MHAGPFEDPIIYGRRSPPIMLTSYSYDNSRVQVSSQWLDNTDPRNIPQLLKSFYSSSSTQKRMATSTSRIDNSELSLETKLACGYVEKDSKENISVTSMIQKRIIGSAFTRGQRCRINNYRLPSMKYHIINNPSKIFFGFYSEDGTFLLTVGQDQMLRLYNTVNDKLDAFKTIPGRDVGECILDAAFSPDGRNIVYSSWSRCLYVCPIHGDPGLQDALWLDPPEGKFGIFALAYSNNGNEIIGSSNDGHLYVYDLTEHQRTLRVEAHSSHANAVTFADNTSQILFSGGDDGLCKVWDRRTLRESNPEPVGVLAGHRGGITYIDSRGDGRHLITNSKDQTIKLWDIRAFSSAKGEENTRLAVETNLWDYRFPRAGSILPLLKTTTLLEGDTSIMTYRGHLVLQTLIRCRFSPLATTGQRYIYTGSADGNVVIYDVLSGQEAAVLRGHRECVRDVSWHPHQPHLVVTSWDGSVETWV